MTDSDSAPSDTEILKRDAVGRVRTDARRREELLNEFERSGLSGPKFARVAGVCYQTFAGWMQKRRRERSWRDGSSLSASSGTPGSGSPLLRWVEAETGADALDGSAAGPAREAAPLLVAEMACGVRVGLTHADQLPLAAEFARCLQNPGSARPC